jgi:hypothetical protein
MRRIGGRTLVAVPRRAGSWRAKAGRF